MDAPTLRALISTGETLTCEFKSDRARLGDEALVEAVVCLSNAAGGTILLGVEDDGAISGLHEKRLPIEPTHVAALVANRTIPACAVECETCGVDGVVVLVIQVPRSESPMSTHQGLFKRRALQSDGRPACVPLHFHEMHSRLASLGRLDPSALVVPTASLADLDPLEIARLREIIARQPGRGEAALLALTDFELLRALGLVEGAQDVEGVRLCGLLMLGREEALRRLVPTHRVSFQVVEQLRPTVNDSFCSPLIRLTDELLARFEARNRSTELELGFAREFIPNYSPRGFREAVMNALLHRDYGAMGSVVIQWRDDELEVSSPGGLIEGVRLDTLIVAGQRPRNSALVQAMHRIGLAEQLGRGIDAIYEGQLRFGRPAPDYSRTTEQSVRVTLPGGAANLALVRFILSRERAQQRLTLADLLIINTLHRERRLDAPRAATIIQRHDTEARRILERLVEEGILEARGERTQRIFRLSAATYAALGEKAEHVRGAGFAAIQHATMVQEYVLQHGRITRSGVADLCQIDSDSAKSLLQRMVADRRLVLHGQRKGAFYTVHSTVLESLSKTQQQRAKRAASTKIAVK